jgi:hypothetical protein
MNSKLFFLFNVYPDILARKLYKKLYKDLYVTDICTYLLLIYSLMNSFMCLYGRESVQSYIKSHFTIYTYAPYENFNLRIKTHCI